MMEDRRTRTVSGIEVSARRIEEVLEEIRAEIGKVETKWAGLSNRDSASTPSTSAENEIESGEFAREMASAHQVDTSDPLVHLFVLRQIEIALAFIARLSGEVSRLNDRVAEIQRQLDRGQGEGG